MSAWLTIPTTPEDWKEAEETLREGKGSEKVGGEIEKLRIAIVKGHVILIKGIRGS